MAKHRCGARRKAKPATKAALRKCMKPITSGHVSAKSAKRAIASKCLKAFTRAYHRGG